MRGDDKQRFFRAMPAVYLQRLSDGPERARDLRAPEKMGECVSYHREMAGSRRWFHGSLEPAAVGRYGQPSGDCVYSATRQNRELIRKFLVGNRAFPSAR